MTDASDDELQRIREQKRKELVEQHAQTEPEQSDGGDDSEETPVQIRGQNHLDSLLESGSPVLVDCYADWCGPCQMMEPTIESLAAETSAVVAKVDIDAHQSLARRLGVQGVPTFVLFVDGEPVERLVGAQDRSTLESLIHQYQ